MVYNKVSFIEPFSRSWTKNRYHVLRCLHKIPALLLERKAAGVHCSIGTSAYVFNLPLEKTVIQNSSHQTDRNLDLTSSQSSGRKKNSPHPSSLSPNDIVILTCLTLANGFPSSKFSSRLTTLSVCRTFGWEVHTYYYYLSNITSIAVVVSSPFV